MVDLEGKEQGSRAEMRRRVGGSKLVLFEASIGRDVVVADGVIVAGEVVASEDRISSLPLSLTLVVVLMLVLARNQGRLACCYPGVKSSRRLIQRHVRRGL